MRWAAQVALLAEVAAPAEELDGALRALREEKELFDFCYQSYQNGQSPEDVNAAALSDESTTEVEEVD